MDINDLAHKTTTALIPYVSQSNAPLAVSELRHVLETKVTGNVLLEAAWNDFVQNPRDEDNVAAFRKELKKLLLTDSNFVLQLATLVNQVTITNVSAGQGGVAVGGDVQGNIVIGNNNTLVEKQITKNQSGGVNIEGGEVNITGDVVGRDKK